MNRIPGPVKRNAGCVCSFILLFGFLSVVIFMIYSVITEDDSNDDDYCIRAENKINKANNIILEKSCLIQDGWWW